MFERIFQSDGPVLNVANKIGQIVTLTFLWILGCIPIVTIGASTTAFYYSMIKTVRMERGYPATEFFHAFRRSLKNGILFTIGAIAAFVLIYINRQYMDSLNTIRGFFMVAAYDFIFFTLCGMLLYLFPDLGRFQLKRMELIKLAVYMEFRYLPTTITLATGFLAAVALTWFLPVPFTLIIPGVWCYLSTYLVERVMQKHTPVPEKGSEAWFDQQQQNRNKGEKV